MMMIRLLFIFSLLIGAVFAQGSVTSRFEIIQFYQGYQTPFVNGVHLTESRHNPAYFAEPGLELSADWRYWSGIDSASGHPTELKRERLYLPQFIRIALGFGNFSFQSGYTQQYNTRITYDYDRGDEGNPFLKIILANYFAGLAYGRTIGSFRFQAGLSLIWHYFSHYNTFEDTEMKVDAGGLAPRLGLLVESPLMQFSFFYDGGIRISKEVQSSITWYGSELILDYRLTLPHRYVLDALFFISPQLSLNIGITSFDFSRQNYRKLYRQYYQTNRPHWRSSLAYQWNDRLQTSLGMMAEAYAVKDYLVDTVTRYYLIGGVRFTLPYTDVFLNIGDSHFFTDEFFRDYYIQMGFRLHGFFK